MLPELSEIGKRRRKLGLKQRELARSADVSQSLIAKIEGGKIDPSYTKAKAIFDALEAAEAKQELRAKDVYTKGVIGVKKGDFVSDAVRIMRAKGISQLPVFEGNNVVGSIGEESILERVSKGEDIRELGKLRVEAVMEESFPRIDEKMPLSLVNALLQRNKAVLITKKEKVIGIITKADLLKVV